MRNRIGAILIAVVITLMVAPSSVCAVAPPKIQPDYYSFLAGYVDTNYHVPVFVLYDPPGTGSYAEFKRSNSTTLGMHFDFLGGPVAAAVDAGASSTFTTTQVVTTAENTTNDNTVVFDLMKMRWELWETDYPSGYVSYQLKLVSATDKGWGDCPFAELPSIAPDIWITKMNGTLGPYNVYQCIGKNHHDSTAFTYTISSYSEVGVGLDIEVCGMAFKLKSQVEISGSQTFEVVEHYYNPSATMQFYLNSEFPLSDFTHLAGLGIWFSPYP